MNSKKWNRVLTSAAVVSLTIGTMAPAAFAATGSAGVQYNTRTMNVGSNYTAVVQGVVAKDVTNMTEFLPIYYLNQGLGKLGYTVKWDGNSRTLNITTPAGVTVNAPSTPVGAPSTNQMVIQVNGTNVQLAPRVVAKDPASGVFTTYAPIWYLDNALKMIGFTFTYNGQSWTINGQAASQSQNATLSTISAGNASAGDGSSSNPAVSLNGAAMTLSTTLKDANGNPLTNTAVTFHFTQYGNLPNNMPLPTVQNASGQFVAPTKGTNAEQYTVYTDSNGVASLTLTGPAGQTYSYEVQATAPYAGSNNSSLSSQPAYIEFVQGNSVGVSPAPSETYNASFGAQVPITVTLPPNAAGQPQSNVMIQLSRTAGNGYFTNSTGADLGTTISVPTNSAGIAQADFTDNSGSTTTDQVQVTLPSTLGLSNPAAVSISYAQAGVPNKIQNYSITATSVQSGQTVTIYGTVVDSSGNPVPNGQLLVAGNSTDALSSNQAHFEYMTGSGSSATTTTFPDVAPVASSAVAVANGSLASSNLGELVTADSAGNFSFTVTDSHENETGYFTIYGVSNGQVATGALKSGSIDFTAGTTLSSIALGNNDSVAQNNTYTSFTGVSVPATTVGTGATIYVDPQNAAGKPISGQSYTYNVSVDNSGNIVGVAPGAGAGSTIAINSTNPGLASIQVTETYVSANDYTLSVPGWGTTTSTNPDFALQVVNSTPGATTLTVQSGSAKSTASINYTSLGANEVANFLPASATVNAGGQQKVSFQVQDVVGNPVTNSAVTIKTDQSSTDPFLITQVNGVTLQEQLNMGSNSSVSYATEATPIPLGYVPSSLNYSVSIPGVASWQNGNPDITVYTDGSGNVNLTLQAGGVSYPTVGSASAGNPNNTYPEPTSASTAPVQFFSDNGANGTAGPDSSTILPLYIGVSAPGASITNSANFTSNGSLYWTSSGVTAPATQFAVTPATIGSVAAAANETITATVLDQYGNPVSGVTVNWAAAAGTNTGTVGTLSGTSSVTNASGQATITYTAPATTTSGKTDVVTASVTGLTSASNTSTITFA